MNAPQTESCIAALESIARSLERLAFLADTVLPRAEKDEEQRLIFEKEE